MDVWVVSTSGLLGIRLLSMNMCVLLFVETYVFISPGYVPNSGIAGSYGISMCNLLRNCQTCSRVVWYLILINLNEIATCGYWPRISADLTSFQHGGGDRLTMVRSWALGVDHLSSQPVSSTYCLCANYLACLCLRFPIYETGIIMYIPYRFVMGWKDNICKALGIYLMVIKDDYYHSCYYWWSSVQCGW